jgi:hypothetical protein
MGLLKTKVANQFHATGTFPAARKPNFLRVTHRRKEEMNNPLHCRGKSPSSAPSKIHTLRIEVRAWVHWENSDFAEFKTEFGRVTRTTGNNSALRVDECLGTKGSKLHRLLVSFVHELHLLITKEMCRDGRRGDTWGSHYTQQQLGSNVGSRRDGVTQHVCKRCTETPLTLL